MAHISYSALKDWYECPYKFKLKWIDRISQFHGNEYTTMGNAIHTVLEYQVKGIKPDNFTSWENFFDNEFLNNIKKSYESGAKKFDKKLVMEMREQGKRLIPFVLPELKKRFGKFQIFETELKLMEPIVDYEKAKFDFKGFIDLVIEKDGKLHVIDWKVMSFWDARKRSDKMILYQLVLYKYFLAQKLKIDLNDIEVHFALLKRTSKKNQIEFMDVTSGSVRVKNAVKMLTEAVHSYNVNFFKKNRIKCKTCEFRRTKYCR